MATETYYHLGIFGVEAIPASSVALGADGDYYFTDEYGRKLHRAYIDRTECERSYLDLLERRLAEQIKERDGCLLDLQASCMELAQAELMVAEQRKLLASQPHQPALESDRAGLAPDHA